MNEKFSHLTNYADIASLRPAVHALCSRYGDVARLDILAASQAGKRQALCFVRLGSSEQERQLMRDLGVGRFGGDLVLVVDLATPTAVRARADCLETA